MAESLLFSIAQGVLGKIASPAFQEAVAVYGVEDQIHELKDTMDAIAAVLLDAEEQQAKNHRLQLWLRRLRDVLYDAEDVLDELECEALRKRVINRRKIKEIRETLSKISVEKNQFDLNVRSVNNGVVHLRSREMTYSFINKLDVVGRESDKEKIIEILMQSDRKNLSVIPIVGIGGMGKTAIAKLVYNDDNVKEQFESGLWVCMPEDFDLKKTIEGIIKDATGQSSSNLDIQQLQTSLRYIIKDKKFLLVLDDVWSNDRSRWEELKALLTEGESGSKIIVTTRISKVASITGTHPAHNLRGLSHEDSMALFKKWAFDQKEKHPRPDLLEMGDDIVKKCQGVPLLVKTLGSLLFAKDEVPYWAHIRDSEVWKLVEEKEDLLPVPKLSYDHLPSHLKRCFATFSLFPRGFEFRSDRLGALWMASGLISSTTEKEDSSVEYVKELWKRSLIQQVEESESILTFKVHDLVHSLATIVARNDCSIVGLDTEEISERARNGSLEELPSSICNLKQLRTLLLSGNKRLKKLPDTICELQSLLHLYLDGCSELGELPKNMQRLVSLRLLTVTTKQKSLQESGIQYLENLQLLGLDGCQNLQVLFEGTCRPTCLRRLEIVNCRGPISIPFVELTALRILEIFDSKLMLTEENKPIFPSNLHTLAISKSEQVMELLQCLDRSACKLESFYVYDCPSFTAIPEWLPNHSHLRYIFLIRCLKLSSMPKGIQSLTALKELRVEYCGESSERCRPTTGVDWPKIAHIPRICLDLVWVQWMED
ncbi:disease resistance protein RGA2-like [Rhodamnia argentea]|uniref:Disease resistance protein RGA2-like n=1 Tax=Rhodamnia argentea TaxID=178133 RepID=A0ABM3H4D2_9MYRT|nr:disease resistance protein RGA2-like [Rhodamnia argentea]